MRSMTYTLDLNPIPLSRPRFGHGRVWDEQKSEKFSAGLMLARQHGNQPKFIGPISIDATFYLPIPKAHKKHFQGKLHTFKPDLDNLLKFICDISNTILYEDDSIISKCTCTKIYDSQPRTVFTITQL